MNRRNLLSALALPMLLSGCGGESATVRFRVIAMVTIDGQPHEGSTVMEITYNKVTRRLIGAGGSTTTYGEALILDLKGRGTVFVLPTLHDRTGGLGEFYEHSLPGTLGIKEGVGTLSDASFERLRQAKGRHPLWTPDAATTKTRPAFVAFKDERIARTIYEVDPRDMWDSFRGVTFVGLDIEFTRAPVTEELRKRLPWLNDGQPDWDRMRGGPDMPSSKDVPIGLKIQSFHFFGKGSRK